MKETFYVLGLKDKKGHWKFSEGNEYGWSDCLTSKCFSKSLPAIKAKRTRMQNSFTNCDYSDTKILKVEAAIISEVEE